MGVLSGLAQGLVRGADRMAQFTSKRGPRTFYKGRGARRTGVLTSSGKFLRLPAMVPQLVVPLMEGFRLKPYVSYRAPTGSEPPLTPKALFTQTVAPAVERDLREGRFHPQELERYGFEPSQDGKLFKLYPKNYVR
ncbi:large ribosomal subunit protein mL41 [Amia ocellicauda]|uniref:large ribosomal subunit protein mL41 n=1 Tax=Amia ocellicauda TaxID=2972642 RepID=UPI003463B10E|nr:RM41 protein [Amia calva]